MVVRILAYLAAGAWLLPFIPLVIARAPLVSLTVSILHNITSEASRNSFQATFDRSDYAYPLPQPGLGTFGFAGELYVPSSAKCADEVIGTFVRNYTKPSHSNGIAFLPYRSCRSQWEWILNEETRAGRAAGALLYSMKDDAAQAAERALVDIAYLHTPVWVVNAVTGDYLIRVMEQVYSQGDMALPLPPTSVEYQHVQDDVRLAVRAATEGAEIETPRVFVTISRSAADVASADRNFFLKAMIGVGITGIVCFFIAMVVKYFDCLRFGRRRSRQRGRGRGAAGRMRRGSEDEDEEDDGEMAQSGIDGRWAAAGGAPGRHHADRMRHVHGQGGPLGREKRVLRQHELDAMPCKVVSTCDLKPGPESKEKEIAAPPAPYRTWSLRASMSCPQLAPLAPRLRPGAETQLQPQRIYSINNVASMHDLPAATAASATATDGSLVQNNAGNPAADGNGWDDAGELECAICLDGIHVGDVIRILPCPHVFHSRCIDRWLLCQSSFCPLCKRDTLFDPATSQAVAADQL
ncbi:hypothetical protein LPJ53_002653 [Coemansia erecta]|uniref:RING-type domain-containing protein n=1 Tax=Coemansia erecta TaxID=147472 RepID=A0A9W7Y340_9FUNG|nr:hypothetical protein LPJ53_002653 [Coemansia erecta]